MSSIIGLDFETYSSADIRRGLDVYFNSPDFRVLLGCVAHGDSAASSTFDFVTNPGLTAQRETRLLEMLDDADVIVAHNAAFERRTLAKMGWTGDPYKIVDSAVAARALGAGSKLEAAAPQLLGVDKMESGLDGIKLFSIPQEDGSVTVDNVKGWTKKTWLAWEQFIEYCILDARLSVNIYSISPFSVFLNGTEWRYEKLTDKMNQRGWFVDVPLVEEMQKQYLQNLGDIEAGFRARHDPDCELNFRSTPKMRAWCKERGITINSFDEQHVERYINRILKALHNPPKSWTQKRIDGAFEVLAMLETKRDLGGSSLSKLQTILDMVGPDGRLRGQYLHIGAGQSFRTSGRGVQMQNLKRLGSSPDDTDEIMLMGQVWDNGKLARNLRQVFMAEHPLGELIVGDFSSVESRGLAYLAGEEWKIDAYRKGQDMYKVLASKMFDVPYESIDKSQRQTGKVGELSCGYGAGAGAVSRFAQKMHVDIDEETAAGIVSDWRATNPAVVNLWAKLDEMLRAFANGSSKEVRHLGHGLTIRFQTDNTPSSLQLQRTGARTLQMVLTHADGAPILQRWFQGVFLDGNDVCYHKPSELKSGKLWMDMWHKNGDSGRYKLYGGKLAGILTQSFCRELFFRAMRRAENAMNQHPNTQLIGQFHDELVVEWSPDVRESTAMSLNGTMSVLEATMSMDPRFPDFPLVADVKHGHRYIK